MVDAPIRVFMIHRSDMSELQATLSSLLTTQKKVSIEDVSYPLSYHIEKVEFIQEYACGRMMDSDIVLVLPPNKRNYEPDWDIVDAELTIFSSTSFARKYGLSRDRVYITELKNIMHDSCNTKPVLVLGWSEEEAEDLADILLHPNPVECGNSDPGRIHSMAIGDSVSADELVSTIQDILDV